MAIVQDVREKRVFGMMVGGEDGYDVIGLKACKGESKSVSLSMDSKLTRHVSLSDSYETHSRRRKEDGFKDLG